MKYRDHRYITSITYDPCWRGKEARHSDDISSDPYVLRYRKFIQDNKDEVKNDDYAIHVAHDIYRTDWFRCEIEAYLMAGASYEEIGKRYDISPEAVECYSSLFFDIGCLKGEGSRKRIANDPTITPGLRRARQFGYRYGKLFLDWYSSKLSSLTLKESQQLDMCLETVLKMKIFDMDRLLLSNGDQMATAIKLLDALTRYKAALSKVDNSKDFDAVLNNLRNLVQRSAPPQGLPSDIFKERVAQVPRNGSHE